MPDKWGYVAAAYALAGLAFVAYWWYLGRRARAARRAAGRPRSRATER